MTAPSKTPPGTSGLPLIGETLGFLKNSYAFVEERAKKHGPVFRTNLLGRDTAVILGSEAAKVFIDGARVSRHGSQPDAVFRLFAGPSLPHLDDAAHAERKALVLSAFTEEAISSYLPAMQARMESALAAWAARDEVALLAGFKRLAVEAVAENIMGVTGREEIERLLEHYDRAGAAFTSLPLALPGTTYARGLAAVDRILEFFDEVIRDHRVRAGGDGLSRILAAATPSGTKVTDDDAKRELHHLVIAGRVVFAHFVGIVMQLAAHPGVRERAIEEVMRVTPKGPLTTQTLRELPYVTRVLMEVKRTSPVVPGMFANAKEDIELHGHVIPKGWMILFGLYEMHQDGVTYPKPHEFDPARFEPEPARARAPWAFCPHGPGAPKTSHHCAGTDYATALAMVFTTLLLRGYAWELPEQDLTFDWSQLTPEPRGGLRARLRAKSPAEGPRETWTSDMFRALAAVAWADGRLVPAEAEALVQTARHVGLSPEGVAEVEAMTKKKTTLDDLSSLPSLGTERAEYLYALACLISAADVEIADAERACIARLGDLLGLSEADRRRAEGAGAGIAAQLGLASAGLEALSRATARVD